MTIPHGYTRVSEILSFFKDYGHVDPEVLKAKAQIGTNVHQAISDFFDDVPYKVEGREIGYFKSFKKWHEKYQMWRVMKEQRFFNHAEMVTGQCDAIMQWELLIPTKVLVDYKTSFEVDEKIWPLQGAFYCWLAKLPIGTEIHFIQLKSDGSDAFPFQFIYTDELEMMRLSAMRIYKYFNPV